MIEARIAGTALHLNVQENKSYESRISYKKYKVWGLKSLIQALIKDIFDTFYLNLPEQESEFNPESDLRIPLKILAKKYSIPFELILDFINERKSSRMIWDSLDKDQKALFYVNSFFEAFEKKIIDAYYICLSLVRFLFLNLDIYPKMKRSDFRKGDFSFLHRARGYAHTFSRLICRGGYDNTVERLNTALLKEYQETFLRDKKSKKRKVSNRKHLSEGKRYIIQTLKNGTTKEKLEAIDVIIENNIYEAVEELEYLLKDQDEKVMNRAFEAITILKNL
ncbi:MAG: hypothetical protein R6U96_04775 [Promethearchaeia archaeon]